MGTIVDTSKMDVASKVLEKIVSPFRRSSTASLLSEVEVYKHSHNATLAWQKLSVKQTVKKLKPLEYNTPVQDSHLRVVCISDTHSQTDNSKLSVIEQFPRGDVLLHAGDFTNIGQPKEVYEFNKWLGLLPHPVKIVIAGNHDLMFQPEHLHTKWTRFGLEPSKVKQQMETLGVSHVRELLTNCTFLQDSETEVCGVRIYGSPWQPEFCDWAFNLPRGQACLDKWNLIPAGIDILLTHGPPVGYGDLTSDAVRAGCVELLHTIQHRVKPKYHVAGHIHGGYGMTTDGDTVYINASTCDHRYRPIHPPIIFDVQIPKGHSKRELLEVVTMTSQDKSWPDKNIST